MFDLVVVLAVMLVVDVTVWRFGADSRDGMDWAPPHRRRRLASPAAFLRRP